jgi:hypothetical protein
LVVGIIIFRKRRGDGQWRLGVHPLKLATGILEQVVPFPHLYLK